MGEKGNVPAEVASASVVAMTVDKAADLGDTALTTGVGIAVERAVEGATRRREDDASEEEPPEGGPAEPVR